MKVVQINSVCGIYSTGRIASDIHKLLIENGHESKIAYGRMTPQNCSDTVRIGSNIDFYLNIIQTRVFDRHGFASRKATKKFIKYLIEFNPDVIHLHNIHGYYINIEMLFEYLKKADKPVFWTMHDCWPFTGHCSYFGFAECSRWETGCYDCPQKDQYPTSLLFDNSKKNYHDKKEIFNGVKNLTIITPSKWLADLVKQSFIGSYNTLVIHNGVDMQVFKPTLSSFRKKYNIENKYIILGVTSTWHYKKGLNVFLELAQLVGEDEIIVMVGLTKDLMQNLPKNIIGIMRTNSTQELAEIYSTADIFANPTFDDNFPTTNLESLACGTPVITFDTGGSGESINENSGYIITEKTSLALYKTIQKVKNERKFVPGKISNYAREKFNKDDRYQEYLNLYLKELI